ncbi:MAG: L-ribulose-5-phosphate 4-epimerase AraD [Spirochaetes bacterium]|nr:L-ribulose-5-phosphate 4-epimerase AraD [Spirochaetota bacterium]
MSFKELRREVFEANLELNRRGLVLYTFGNVSGIDRRRGVLAIKPSGVPYDDLHPRDLVLVDLENRVVEGKLKPSSDTKTHVVLYREMPSVGGVCHTHSTQATAWCQAARALPCYGTTHADYAHGEVPVTAVLTAAQVGRDYEEETGHQIMAVMGSRNPAETPMILVAGHAPFTWGKDAAQAVYHAAILEQLAEMATLTLAIRPEAAPLPSHILDKHYQRKHGKNAYYGQGPAH